MLGFSLGIALRLASEHPPEPKEAEGYAPSGDATEGHVPTGYTQQR